MLNPQIIQQLLAQRMAQGKGGGAAAPNGVPISFANSGGASPPMGVSGGAGGGVGAQNMGGGTGAGVGTGIQGFSFPGSSTAAQNIGVGATQGGNVAGLGSEGSLQAGQANKMSNPQTATEALSVLTDLTSGVGPPLGTKYGTPTQGDTGNPAGPVGMPPDQPFEAGMPGGSPTPGGTGPGAASLGQSIQNLIAPGNKSSMGRTIPNKRPASNSLNVGSVFPQTGLQPYRGVLG